MSFQIAIPSYQRVNILATKTLRFLTGVPTDRITIFVASPEEEALYRARHPDLKLVVGVPGIGGQRTFMEMYYPVGTRVLFIDDDLVNLKTPYNQMPFAQLVERCFTVADREGCSLWGFHPNDDGRCLKDEAIVGLRYIIGVCYGLTIGTPIEYPRPTNEDWTRSMELFKRDGKVLRFNGIGICSKPYAEGGLTAYRRNGTQEAEMLATAAEYPELCKVRRRTGKPVDIRLAVITHKRIAVPLS